MPAPLRVAARIVLAAEAVHAAGLAFGKLVAEHRAVLVGDVELAAAIRTMRAVLDQALAVIEKEPAQATAPDDGGTRFSLLEVD